MFDICVFVFLLVERLYFILCLYCLCLFLQRRWCLTSSSRDSGVDEVMRGSSDEKIEGWRREEEQEGWGGGQLGGEAGV